MVCHQTLGRRSAYRPVGGVPRRRDLVDYMDGAVEKCGWCGGKIWMVRPRRFELLAYSFGGCRSIQLSYGRIFGINNL